MRRHEKLPSFLFFYGLFWNYLRRQCEKLHPKTKQNKKQNTILKISLSQVIVYIFRDHTVAGFVDRFDY